MEWYSRLCLYMVIMFVVLETIEITRSLMSHGASGVADYVADLWNWIDWINFGCFMLCYLHS